MAPETGPYRLAPDRAGRFTLPLPGTSLYGEVHGHGPGAIFLHGFGGDVRGWDPIWAALDDRLDALCYDLRGFGQSPLLSQAPFNHCHDLLALMDSAAIAQADLIGMSMGGGVAIRFALDYPERVRRLVLISPMLTGWDWSPQWRMLWRQMVAYARGGAMDEAKALWLAHPLFETTRSSAAAPLLAQSIAAYSGAQWIADHEQPLLPDVDRLPHLQPSTLLLTGALDLPDFRLMADLIAGSGRAVTRIDYPGCGHMLTLEAPEACAAAISRFL